MAKINEEKFVHEEYKKADGLNTRISIHEKYSTNKMGVGNWYFTKYEIKDGMKVLELGCGSGAMWVNHKDVIGRFSKLVLSDLTEGMLAETKKNVGEAGNIEYKVIDIQDIPYEDSSFDMVIANYMLYHVPDISKALSEVRRVLKDDGIFYAGTAGENGIMENLIRMLGQEMFYNNSFSLENGEDKLKQVFSQIDIERYPDSLAVTNIEDLMDYIYSGITFKNECTLSRDEVRTILTGKMVDGVLVLPKDPGMFVARGIA